MPRSFAVRLSIRARRRQMTSLTVHLHAWPTGFYLGLICRQVISVTAGSIMPQCTQRSDRLGRPRSPISGCPTYRKQRQCNATGELSKRGKRGCSSYSSPQGGGTEAADPKLCYRYGSSPRAEQDVLQDVLREGRRSERKASSPKVCCKIVALET